MSAKQRVVSEVGLDGATVFYSTKELAAFLTKSGLILWVEFSERKDLGKMVPNEGGCVWVYYAKHNNRVISFLPSNGEDIAELPKIDSVQL